MRDRVVSEDPERLEDRGDPRLVVTPEHRGAVGLDDVAAHARRDGLAGHDSVHVGAEEQGRRAGDRAREPGEEVARFAPDLPAGVVLLDAHAHFFEGGGEALGHPPLALGGARDPDHLEKLGDEPRAVDHAQTRSKSRQAFVER